MSNPRFPEVIDGRGSHGNIFWIIDALRALAREEGLDEHEISEHCQRIRSSGSYSGAIAIVREWYDVELDEA